MKAVVFREHGGPEKLSYEEMPEPQIGPDDVLIRVRACALNHLDIWIRQGSPAYPMPLPHISGSDIAGEVEAVGGHVDGVRADSIKVGERVFLSPGISCWRCNECLAGRDNFCRSYTLIGAMAHGGYAEYVKVPIRNVLPIPGNLSFEQAAAFPLVSVTASHMLFSLAQLQLGETVLVMGAGSGVGSMAVQMAHLAGARVITTVGSEDKIQKAALLGAHAVIDHRREKVAERVKLLTEGRGSTWSSSISGRRCGSSAWPRWPGRSLDRLRRPRPGRRLNWICGMSTADSSRSRALIWVPGPSWSRRPNSWVREAQAGHRPDLSPQGGEGCAGTAFISKIFR